MRSTMKSKICHGPFKTVLKKKLKLEETCNQCWMSSRSGRAMTWRPWGNTLQARSWKILTKILTSCSKLSVSMTITRLISSIVALYGWENCSILHRHLSSKCHYGWVSLLSYFVDLLLPMGLIFIYWLQENHSKALRILCICLSLF